MAELEVDKRFLPELRVVWYKQLLDMKQKRTFKRRIARNIMILILISTVFYHLSLLFHF